MRQRKFFTQNSTYTHSKEPQDMLFSSKLELEIIDLLIYAVSVIVFWHPKAFVGAITSGTRFSNFGNEEAPPFYIRTCELKKNQSRLTRSFVAISVMFSNR